MKKQLKRKLLLCLFLITILVTGCVPDGEFRLAPVGGGGSGGSGFMDWWQGKTPTQPAQAPTTATGLAKAEASPSPEPTASTIPMGEPDTQGLETIAGVQEVHTVSSQLTCHQMQKKFREQGLRLTLTDIFDVNQPGRIGAPRKKSKRNSRKYGKMFLCLFQGPDAVENRYALNDDYEKAGVPYPQQYPNDYRPPEQPFQDYNYSQDPHMGNPPPPPADAEIPF